MLFVASFVRVTIRCTGLRLATIRSIELFTGPYLSSRNCAGKYLLLCFLLEIVVDVVRVGRGGVVELEESP